MVLPALSAIPILGPIIGGIASLFGGGGQQQPQQQAPAGLPLEQIIGLLGRAAPGGGGTAAAAQAPAFDPQVLAPIVRDAVAATLRGSGFNVTGLDQQAVGGLAQVGRDATTREVRAHQNAASRATVEAVRAELGPELRAIKQRAEHRAAQVEATAEHRDRVARDEFRREVLARLARIERSPPPRRY